MDRLNLSEDNLILGGTALLAILTLILWFPIGLYRAPSAERAVLASQDLTDYRESVSGYASDVTDRPLFHRTRRPVAAPEAPIVAPVTLNLVGILSDGNDRIALVRLSNSPTLYRLKAGDVLQDWTVRSIAEGEIVVKKRGEPAITIGMSN